MTAPRYLTRIMSGPARAVALALTLLLVLGAVGAGLFPPQVRLTLAPGKIRTEEGAAYVIALPVRHRGVFWLSGDSTSGPGESSLQVIEDGRPLGPAHAAHTLIRTQGRGAFSHWEGALFFSASDNSDPHNNGRVYEVLGTLVLPRPLRLLIWVAGVLVGLLLFRGEVLAGLRWAREHLLQGESPVPHTVLRFRWAGLALALATGVGMALANRYAGEIRLTLDPQRIRAEIDRAYLCPLPNADGWLFRLDGDSKMALAVSSLRLFEDGKPLGPAHTRHDRIRTHGRGAFSHWGDDLVFSSSDGTDPRHNGRKYEVRMRAVLTRGLRFGGWVLGALVALFFFRPATRRFLRWAGSPPRRASRGAGTSVAVLCAVCVVCFVAYSWRSGSSGLMSIGGYWPVSDAAGYQDCAMSLAATGSFHAPDWCSRRALYPAVLAGCLLACDWDMHLVLILQAVLIGLAIFAVCVEVARLVGRAPGVLVFVALWIYAREFALLTSTTEVAGLSAGLAGTALLLRYVDTRSRGLLLAGLGLVSVGLTARAGALVTLPALALWGWYSYGAKTPLKRVGSALLLLLAALAGPLIQAGVLVALGIDVQNTGGSFSTVLYGLSTGSHDWTQAYQDFAPLFQGSEAEAFRRVYVETMRNIVTRPQVFLLSLFQAAKLYVTGLFSFGSLMPWNLALSLLLLAGLAITARRRRAPLSGLLLTMCAAELISAPLIADTGGHRVFAATIALRILLAAIGLKALFVLLAGGGVDDDGKVVAQPRDRRPLLPLGVGVLLLAAMILPATPLAGMFRLKPLAGAGCRSGLTEVVAQVDRESPTLGVVNNAAGASVEPFRTTGARLDDDPHLISAWWGWDYQEIVAGTVVLNALQRLPASTRVLYRLAWDPSVNVAPAPATSFCVDQKATISLAGTTYQRVVSATPLAPR